MKDIEKLILEYKEDIISSIERLVRIPSIEGEIRGDSPFGLYPRLALEEALNISKELGFETKNIDNVIGYAEYGQGEEYIAVIGHLDIVPEGSGWSYDPFNVTRVDGKLYGRGVLDNKGPIMTALYALKIIKDLDIKIKKKIRVIFGTNEESGFKDVGYYLNKEKPPVMGFTPDCKYPIVYGEKGILEVRLSKRVISEKSKKGRIVEIKGNFINNAVPEKVEIEFENVERNYFNMDDENIKITQNLDNVSLVYEGKLAHSKSPENGRNAITYISSYLKEFEFLTDEFKGFFDFIHDSFHLKHYGEGCNMKVNDKNSGNLVLNPYRIYYSGNEIGISLHVRYPISCNFEYVYRKLYKLAMDNNLNIEIIRRIDSVNFPLNHKMIKILRDVYEEETGLDSTPVTTNGGTYAKVMPNIVAFGPTLPGDECNAHEKDECIEIDSLMLNTKIFVNAMCKLANS